MKFPLVFLSCFLLCSYGFELGENDQDGRYCWQFSDAQGDKILAVAHKVFDQFGDTDEAAQELNAQMEKIFGGGWLSITGDKYHLKLTSAKQFCAIKYRSRVITVVKYSDSSESVSEKQSGGTASVKPVRLMPWEGRR